jgi:hypothetical protein
MFDRHLNGHHRLSFYAHGPEWAFVIPHGDYDALLDVVKVCSRVWNGAGALIFAAGSNGRLRGNWKRYARTRPLDETWLYPSLSDDAKRAVTEQSGLRAFEWSDAMDALHAAELVEPAPRPDARWAMTIPEFRSRPLRRVATVSWGVIERHWEWDERFDIGVAEGDVAFLALLNGQVGFNMASPLRISQVSMRIFGQWDEQAWPYLWIFERADFDELVAFWNFRSGASAKNRFASVVGLPHQALTHPDLLNTLETWARASTGPPRTPDLLVHASAKRLPQLQAALSAAGLDRLSDAERPRRRDSPSAPERPTWLPWDLVPNGRLVRGACDDAEFSVQNGEALVTLPRPRGYRPRGGARLVLQSLPTPLPLTETAAMRVFHGAYAHPRGLGINMGSGSPWSLTLQLPDEQTALKDWARDHGYDASESPAGKDARALLQRLGDLSRLQGLADEVALDVLVALAPMSRDRLINKLAKAFARPADQDRLADALAEQLRDEGLLLELDARTVEQLQSAVSPGTSRKSILRALGSLVELGFVRRGRNVECPRCRFPAFVLLRELGEHVRCRGCTLEYLLEVSGPGGEEAKPAYRLDGLMARLMDRHVLPVLLALRALHDPARHWSPQHVWPGVLFKAAGARPFDVDLVASDGREVFVAECKLDGRGLGMPQLRGLLAFCARVGATPVVAALAGEFTARSGARSRRATVSCWNGRTCSR